MAYDSGMVDKLTQMKRRPFLVPLLLPVEVQVAPDKAGAVRFAGDFALRPPCPTIR